MRTASLDARNTIKAATWEASMTFPAALRSPTSASEDRRPTKGCVDGTRRDVVDSNAASPQMLLQRDAQTVQTASAFP